MRELWNKRLDRGECVSEMCIFLKEEKLFVFFSLPININNA